MIFSKTKVAAVALTLLFVLGIASRPASAFSAAVRPTALLSATHPAAFFSVHSPRPAAARQCKRRTAAVLPVMVMSAAGRNEASAEEEDRAVAAPGREKKVMCHVLVCFWVSLCVQSWCAFFCVQEGGRLRVSQHLQMSNFLICAQSAVQLSRSE